MLYDTYKDRGFTVLGFPCNQFGGQEPGTGAAPHSSHLTPLASMLHQWFPLPPSRALAEAEIEHFVCSRFKVTFPMFSKLEVSGEGIHPLYKFLGKEKPGLMVRVRRDLTLARVLAHRLRLHAHRTRSQGKESPWWNFGKFLLNRDGVVVERYGPSTTPAAIAADIEKLL